MSTIYDGYDRLVQELNDKMAVVSNEVRELLAAIERAGLHAHRLPDGKYWLGKIREGRPVATEADKQVAQDIFNHVRDDVRKQQESQ